MARANMYDQHEYFQPWLDGRVDSLQASYAIVCREHPPGSKDWQKQRQDRFISEMMEQSAQLMHSMLSAGKHTTAKACRSVIALRLSERRADRKAEQEERKEVRVENETFTQTRLF